MSSTPATLRPLLVVALWTASHALTYQSHGKGTNKPHIIYILADDLGYGSVGYANNTLKTPSIDKLATAGIKLTSYYTYTECAPSRFSLLTGRDAYKSESVGNNFKPVLPMGTNLAYKMLPASLKEAGYATHMIGKWHQGFHRKEYLPTFRGFDSFFGILTGSSDHYTQENDNGETRRCTTGGSGAVDLMHDATPTWPRQNSYGDAQYTDRAIQLIRAHGRARRKAPFFLYLALQLPHSPFQVPEKYSSLYSSSDHNANVYHGMISHLDESVERVVAALHDAKMYDDAVIVFASDNGAPLNAPKQSNGILRGFKGDTFEGGLRVPAVVSGGFVPAAAHGRELKGLVSISDWYATLAGLAHAQVDDSGPWPSDSIDQWSYLVGTNESSPRQEIIHQFSSETGHAAIRSGRLKFVTGASTHSNRCTYGQPCVFDIEADPTESKDLLQAKDEAAERLYDSFLDKANLVQENAQGRGPMFTQLWYHRDVLSTAAKQSCAAWKAAGGHIIPWASEEIEAGFYKALGN